MPLLPPPDLINLPQNVSSIFSLFAPHPRLILPYHLLHVQSVCCSLLTPHFNTRSVQHCRSPCSHHTQDSPACRAISSAAGPGSDQRIRNMSLVILICTAHLIPVETAHWTLHHIHLRRAGRLNRYLLIVRRLRTAGVSKLHARLMYALLVVRHQRVAAMVEVDLRALPAVGCLRIAAINRLGVGMVNALLAVGRLRTASISKRCARC